MVAVFIPGYTVMFTMLPRWNGVSKLEPLGREGGILKQVFDKNKT
jgi:hypothetical protein